MLMNVIMATMVGIFTFISMINFMLSLVEHAKSLLLRAQDQMKSSDHSHIEPPATLDMLEQSKPSKANELLYGLCIVSMHYATS